ncbi:MAG: hypothetical protein ACXVEF_20960, partial [Polyangiales bacterium]
MTRSWVVAVVLGVACSHASPPPMPSASVREDVERAMGTLPRDGFTSMRSIGANLKPDVLRTLAVDLPAFADEPVAMKASTGESLTMTPRGIRHARFRTESGTVIAEQVADKVDALWSATENRAELYYVLRDPSAARSYRFGLQADDLAVETEGTIAIKHGEHVALRIPRPFAVDARGTRREAGMRLEGKELVVELDTKDLVFPVVLDPGVETATWTKIGGAPSPFSSGGRCIAESGGKLLVFGAGATYDETWEFDGTTWSKKLPATTPPARYSCSTTIRAGKPTVFGGRDKTTGNYLSDTWEWNGTNWTPVGSGAPTWRDGAVFRGNGSQIVFFGGVTQAGTWMADTWTFDGTTWTQYTGAQPAARYTCNVAGRVTSGVMIGGGSDSAYTQLTDVWVWSGTAWSKKPDMPLGWGFTDGTNAYVNYDEKTGSASVFDGSTWTTKTPALTGVKRNIDYAIVPGSVYEGTTAEWLFSFAKGEGWPTIEKLSGGVFSVAGDLSDTPTGILGSQGGEPIIVYLRNNTLARTWKRASGAWTSTTVPYLRYSTGGWTLVESGANLYGLHCMGASSFEMLRATATGWTVVTSGTANCPSVSNTDNEELPADYAAVSASGDTFFRDVRISGTTVSNTGLFGAIFASLKGVVHAIDPSSGSVQKWNGSSFTTVVASGPTSIERVASVGNRIVALRKTSPTSYSVSVFDGAAWRNLATTGGPTSLTNFVGAGLHFYGHRETGVSPTSGPDFWELDIGYDLGTTCTLDADCTSGHCTDSVCCDVASCGAGSSCNASVKGSCRKLDGTACAAAAECSSSICAGGTCCATACDTTTHTCGALGKAGTCLKILGQPATAGAECASGIVADGMCCDAACTGKCVSCKGSETVGGADGTCSPVKSGTPATECPGPTGPNDCGPDGTCDGAGACRKNALDTKTCGVASCDVSTGKGRHCDGFGMCIDGPFDCAPFVCADATKCLTACTTPSDCKASGMRCAAGACVPLVENGKACTMGDECASKNCVDGVCCNNACDGQCQACNTPGSMGTCSAVKGDPVGGRAACNGAGTPCAGSCDGVGAACAYPSIGTDCGTACTDGKFVDKKCDNKGACVSKDPVSCNNYACETTGCKNSCVDKSDCATADFDCKDGKCVPQATARCADDGIHILEGDKVPVDCSPRRCKGGKCVETCIDRALDCVPGSLC